MCTALEANIRVEPEFSAVLAVQRVWMETECPAAVDAAEWDRVTVVGPHFCRDELVFVWTEHALRDCVRHTKMFEVVERRNAYFTVVEYLLKVHYCAVCALVEVAVDALESVAIIAVEVGSTAVTSCGVSCETCEYELVSVFTFDAVCALEAVVYDLHDVQRPRVVEYTRVRSVRRFIVELQSLFVLTVVVVVNLFWQL